MNCTVRLLAIIGCGCAFSGCNLGESDAEANSPSPSIAVTESDTVSVAAATSAPSTVSAPAEPDTIAQVVESSDAEIEGDASQEPASPNEAATAESDVADVDPESRYTYSDDHDPNGIGKFYMGREIAHVMGHQGIAWLERPEREEEERLSLLIECLKIEEGSTVADIGAGSGVITTRLCDAVGDEGTVVAVDIQQEMLDALQLKCHELGYRNVELVLGTPESPQLAEGTLDLVIMVDVYHEFDHPYEMLLEISRSLAPGGRVAFVEYRKEDPTVPIKEIHKMTEAQVRLEAEQPEFQLEYVETVDELPRQHVIIFRRIEAAEEP